MTLTDVADTGSKKPVEPTTGDRELLLDYTKRVADQPSRRADQERGMDLDSEAEDRAPIPVADNACPSTVVNGAMDEENFRPVVEGMDIEQGEVEKRSAERESTEVVRKSEIAGQSERKSDTEDYVQKAEVSSSTGDGVAANISTQDPESPVNESSPDRPLSRLRRSDASRPGLRKLNTAKTRSSSLTSQRTSGKVTLNQDPHAGATPESKANHDVRGSRKRGDDGEELRQTSSSEDLNGDGDGDGDEVDGTGYRCGICNEDFESAKSLNLHKKYHPQYTLRHNPKRSRKLIDQEFAVEAGVAGAPVQASAPTKKTSSMSEEFPKPCTECGKEFPSWKALFGHMRCHPEREWRGIQPPAEKAHPGGQGSGPHAAGNHTSFRRRKPAPSAAQLPPPPAAPSALAQIPDDNEKSGSLDSRRAHAAGNDSDSDSIEAAYVSNGDRQAVMGWMKRSKRSRQTHRSLDAVNSAKTESYDMIEALMLLQSAKEKLTPVVLPPESPGRHSGTSESGLEAEEDELPHMDRRVKTEAEVASPCGDTEDGGDDPDAGGEGAGPKSKYECATCNRQFKSHQALGGHRASHKKVKGCYARTNVNDDGAHEQSHDSMEPEYEEAPTSPDQQQQQQMPNELPEVSHSSEDDNNNNNKPCYLTTARDDNEEMLNVATRKTKAHQCTICLRVFTSGQALGGHKRCHWLGAGGPSGEVTSKPVEVQTGQQSRPFKEGVQLDLNLPAPECLEEEMAQQDMQAAGMSPMNDNNYVPNTGAGLSFFNMLNNASRNSYGDSPVEPGQQQQQQQQGEAAGFMQPDDSEPSSSTHVEASSRMEGINQFSNFDRYGPLDTMPTIIHPKPHVASMALVPGLTPTSA